MTLIGIPSIFAWAADEQFTVTPNGAGKIKIANNMDSLYEFYSKDLTTAIDLKKEGRPTPAIKIYSSIEYKKKDIPDLIVTEYQGKISSISIMDSRFVTTSGFKVGSTLSEIRKKYKLDLSMAEGTLSAIAKNEGFTFVLEDSDFWQKISLNAGKKLDSMVPGSARVSEIYIYSKPRSQ